MKKIFSFFIHWIKQIFIAFDQLFNSIIGGWADETFSARCWRLQYKPFWNMFRRITDTLFFFDKDHCQNAYRSEILRLQSPPEARTDEDIYL